MVGPNGGQNILRTDRNSWGLLPRTADYLLGILNQKQEDGLLSFSVKASFLQIYNENLYDLLRYAVKNRIFIRCQFFYMIETLVL